MALFYIRFLQATKVTLLTVLLSVAGCGKNEMPVETSRGTLNHSVYIWQRQWTPDLAASITRAAPSVCSFMVLVGEIEKRQDAFHYVDVSVNWQALTAPKKPVWIVFRSCTGFIDKNGDSSFDLSPYFNQGIAAAKNAGVHLAGIQVDFDCPTEMLGGYALFLKQLRKKFPDTRLSVTALPTWLPQQSFRDVVSGLDHFVLQVHSLDRPNDINAPLILCDTEKIPHWLEQASRIKTPYYLALPTYGYRIYFDSTGGFAGLGAETHSEPFIGHTSRDVYANPVAMASVVQSLRQNRPKGLLGAVWFRLPIDADRFNWSWPILQSVMEGVAPQAEVAIEIRSPRDNLFEAWITHSGEYYPATVRVPITWEHGELQAADTMNRFQVETFPGSEGIELMGPVPESEEAVMVAWCVIKPQSEEQPVSLAKPMVEIMK